MTGARLISFLRTPFATLCVLVAALLAQLPHAADVFRLVIAADGWQATLHGYSYALALELAVLLFVVQRRNVESYIFALVSVCVNLAYYHLHGVALFSLSAAPAWLISVALPAAIARYSHLIVDAARPQSTDATHFVAPVRIVQDAPPPVVIDARTQALQMAQEGMSAAQIARLLDVKPSTVRSWLRRARKEAI